MLLPEVSPPNASKVAERLLASVQAASLGGLPAGTVTVSIGVAEGPVDEADTTETIYKRADEMLYQAKHGGRNRVCVMAAASDKSPDMLASSCITLEPPEAERTV